MCPLKYGATIYPSSHELFASQIFIIVMIRATNAAHASHLLWWSITFFDVAETKVWKRGHRKLHNDPCSHTLKNVIIWRLCKAIKSMAHIPWLRLLWISEKFVLKAEYLNSISSHSSHSPSLISITLQRYLQIC